MENYLSARWPTEIPKPAQPKKKKNKRRVWRDILVALFAVVVLAGLIAGSFFGAQYAAQYYLGQQGGEQGGSSVKPSLPPLDQETPWTPDHLLKGELDSAFALDVRSREGLEELRANEIYKKVLPSIVVIGAGGGGGSGIVISESGYILTNYHILEMSQAPWISVMRLSDQMVFEDVALVGYDRELDLAVLKAEGEGFVPAELGSSDELEVGDPIYAIGNPLGDLIGTMTEGIVSTVGNRFASMDYPSRLIQVSAPLNSGNSGGALVDAYGRVVGITYAKLTGIVYDTVLEGLGLAIPISDAQPYLERMIHTGTSARPSMGIYCSEATLGERPCIYIAEVVAGTPAEGKLQPGDLILSVNGVEATSVDDMTRMFARMEPGETVELVIWRNGTEQTVFVALYDRLSELQ